MSQKETYIPHYTYNDYINWEGRWELIEGHPIAMSPLPVPEHQRVAAEIRFAFMAALKKAKCSTCKAYDPLDYKITDDTILQPDVLIVCGNIHKPYLEFPPILVVEILSPSTAIRDRNFKYKTYWQQGVKYYLIVDVRSQTIEINVHGDESYNLQTSNDNFTFEFDRDCLIVPDFKGIWE